MDEADLADFTSISDANGEIAKQDLIVHTKASSFWSSYMDAKSKPGSHTSKVRMKEKSNHITISYGHFSSMDNH